MASLTSMFLMAFKLLVIPLTLMFLPVIFLIMSIVSMLGRLEPDTPEPKKKATKSSRKTKSNLGKKRKLKGPSVENVSRRRVSEGKDNAVSASSKSKEKLVQSISTPSNESVNRENMEPNLPRDAHTAALQVKKRMRVNVLHGSDVRREKPIIPGSTVQESVFGLDEDDEKDSNRDKKEISKANTSLRVDVPTNASEDIPPPIAVQPHKKAANHDFASRIPEQVRKILQEHEHISDDNTMFADIVEDFATRPLQRQDDSVNMGLLHPSLETIREVKLDDEDDAYNDVTVRHCSQIMEEDVDDSSFDDSNGSILAKLFDNSEYRESFDSTLQNQIYGLLQTEDCVNKVTQTTIQPMQYGSKAAIVEEVDGDGGGLEMASSYVSHILTKVDEPEDNNSENLSPNIMNVLTSVPKVEFADEDENDSDGDEYGFPKHVAANTKHFETSCISSPDKKATSSPPRSLSATAMYRLDKAYGHLPDQGLGSADSSTKSWDKVDSHAA